MPQTNTVVPIRTLMSKDDVAKAELLVAKILLRISSCYGMEDRVMSFRVPVEPPAREVLILAREILTEDYEYEEVEWYCHDNFMWDIIVYRQNIPLL